MAKPFSKGYSFSFTLNNPNKDLDPSKLLDVGKEKILYAVWQLEEGESKTPHFQGHVRLVSVGRNQYRIKECLALFNPAYGKPSLFAITVAELASIRYCLKKDKTYREGPWTIGTLPSTQAEVDDVKANSGIKEDRWAAFWREQMIQIANDHLNNVASYSPNEWLLKWDEIAEAVLGHAKDKFKVARA